MHRGLFVFGLLLLLLSFAFGFYPIAILGLIFLVSSFFAGQTKPKPTTPSLPTPTTTAGPSRMRQTRPVPVSKPSVEKPTAEKVQTQVPPEVVTHFIPPEQAAPPTPSSSVLLPPLFPRTMFPSISLPIQPIQPVQPMQPARVEEPKPERREERDELVYAIAALALLRVLNQGT